VIDALSEHKLLLTALPSNLPLALVTCWH